MMWWISLLFTLCGVLMIVIGWVMNTQTPIQNQLPVVGGILVIVGVVMAIWFS